MPSSNFALGSQSLLKKFPRVGTNESRAASAGCLAAFFLLAFTMEFVYPTPWTALDGTGGALFAHSCHCVAA